MGESTSFIVAFSRAWKMLVFAGRWYERLVPVRSGRVTCWWCVFRLQSANLSLLPVSIGSEVQRYYFLGRFWSLPYGIFSKELPNNEATERTTDMRKLFYTYAH